LLPFRREKVTAAGNAHGDFPYFFHTFSNGNKKGLQQTLQAFDIEANLVGSASFELATPAV
jgi:hypothetical protein